MLMPFGKYKGLPIAEVPETALKHYLAWDALYTDTRRQIDAELARRAEGDPLPLDQGAMTLDPVMDCALDLIASGESTLIAQHPGRARTVREAAELLRDCLDRVPDQAERDDTRDVVF